MQFNSTFWIGVVVGVLAYYGYMRYQAQKAG